MGLTLLTGLLTIIWDNVTELGTVVKHVITSVGSCWSHSRAQSTALLALRLDELVPAVALGEVGAVGEPVLAVRGVGGGGGGGGGGHRLAGRG